MAAQDPRTAKRRDGKTNNYIEELAEQAAGIRRVDPGKDPRWTPERDMTMTKDAAPLLQENFLDPRASSGQTRPAQRPPAHQQQVQRPPQQAPKAPPQAPAKQAAKPKPSSYEVHFTQAQILIKKHNRGEMTKAQVSQGLRKVMAAIEADISNIQNNLSRAENEFMNNRMELSRYQSINRSLSGELERLRGLKDKILAKL